MSFKFGRPIAVASIFATITALAVAPATADPSDGGGDEVAWTYTVDYFQADSPEEADEMIDEGDLGDSGSSGLESQASGDIKYGPCKLTVQGIHLRKYDNYNTVGFKSFTTCDVKVTSIAHYMRFREKVGLTWWERVPTTGTSNINRNEASLKSIGTSYTCGAKKPMHWWSGRTKGVMVYNGETYYAAAIAPISENIIPCTS